MAWNGGQSSMIYQVTFDSCSLQTSSGEWITASFRKCFSSNKMNVDTIQWSVSTFHQQGYRLLKCKLRKVNWRDGSAAKPAWSPDLTSMDFLWGSMKYKVGHTSMVETRQQLLEGIEKTTAAVRNETQMHQHMRCSMEWCLPAYIWAKGCNFEKII
jgi:hypothetical protein